MTENRTIQHEDGEDTYEQYFDWDSKQKGLILSSFFYGYICTQVFWYLSITWKLVNFLIRFQVHRRLSRIPFWWKQDFCTWHWSHSPSDFDYTSRSQHKPLFSAHDQNCWRHFRRLNVSMHVRCLVEVGATTWENTNGRFCNCWKLCWHCCCYASVWNFSCSSRLGKCFLCLWRYRLSMVLPLDFYRKTKSTRRSQHDARREKLHHC